MTIGIFWQELLTSVRLPLASEILSIDRYLQIDRVPIYSVNTTVRASFERCLAVNAPSKMKKRAQKRTRKRILFLCLTGFGSTVQHSVHNRGCIE